MNASIRILVAIAMATLLCTMAWAQGETGQITGVVTDPSGAVVPNAKVTAKLQTTGAERTAVTTEAGVYAITNLMPGAYTLTVTAGGFSTTQRPAVLAVGARVGADFRLEIGREETVIQVTETAGTVNTETQTVGTVINSTQIMELPSLTRNPYDFVSAAGNVNPTSDLGSSPRGVNYAINGQRSTSVNIQLDGASNNNDFYTGVGTRVPLDAVAEYSLLTSNFTAEVGRAGGGVVNVITKSGTNELHGSVYEYLRASKLASNSFNNNANGVAKEHYTRNQFGYSIGGPIKKDKLFFFQSTEWTRVRSVSSNIVYAPTPQLIAAAAPATQTFFSNYGTIRTDATSLGSFSRNQLTALGFDPCAGASAGGPCLSLNPNMAMFTRYQYLVPGDSGAGNPQNTYQLVGRADYNLNSKTQIYGRWVLDRESDSAGAAPNNSVYQGYDTPYMVSNNGLSASITRTVSPTVVAQSRLSFTRLNVQQPLGDKPAQPTLYFNSQVGATILGDYVHLPGYLPTQPGLGIPGGGAQNTYAIQQDISVVKGKHQLRFGGSYTFIKDNEMFAAYLNPVEVLGSGSIPSGLDALLRGTISTYKSAVDPQGKYPCNGATTPQCSVIKPVGSPDFTRSNLYNEFAFYGQDSWRISRRLTLNLGLRWEYFGVQHNSVPSKDSNFYDGGGGTIFQQLRNGDVTLAQNSAIGGLWAKDWNNFAPRLGFAWDVFGNGKTSFRGGYGIGYERNFGNVTFNLIQNPPSYAVLNITPADMGAPIPISSDLRGPLAGTSGSARLLPTSLRNVNMNIRTAYAGFWSFSLEREVRPSLTLAAEYTGSKGSKLYSMENPNRVGSGAVYLGDPCTPGFDANGSPLCTPRLLQSKGYSDINRRGNNGFSVYHGLNLKAEMKDLAKTGLNLSFNYTWSHAIDNMSTAFSEYNNDYTLGLLDPFNPQLDKGNASFDARHRISISGIWEIPFAKNTKGIARHILNGWEIAPIITARTGNPYSLYDFTWNSGYGGNPRAMFDAAVPTHGPATLVAAGTPNTFTWLDLTNPALMINSNYVNPITGTSDFGPYPANMSGRNTFYGAGVFNMDLGIYKSFIVTERLKAQFRFESYNTLNHPNLFVDTTSVLIPYYNFVSASYAGNRNIQMALKLSW
jgi:hypothetical protein